MKKIFFAFISLSLLLIAFGCDKDLPYPLDEVKRGVLIDITRIPGSDGVLSDGLTTGNYKIKLIIPENQGDYSFMKHAQLLAVLRGPDGKWKTAVAIDNITQFPQEITLNIADVYSKFGLSAPALGQLLYFTTNVVLNDDSVIPGWTEYTGFNNVAFGGWMIEGRGYSSNIRYVVACPLVLEDFVGECFVYRDDWWGEEPYPIEVTKISDTQLSIEGMFEGEAENALIITVNPTDHSITIPRQVLAPNSNMWWSHQNVGYKNFNLEGTGTINACELSISFTATARVDAGSFGAYSFKLGK